jgi:RimJ/RimL family protein N-acetyltransferase
MLVTYPRELESVLTLRTGARVRVRPIRPDDEQGLRALHARLSPDSLYHRFFSPRRELSAAAARELATVDYERRLALVATPEESDDTLVAVARYAESLDEPTAAEIAIVVEDGWQRLGLGSSLLSQLLRAAEERGFHTFRADVLATNQRMLRLLRRATTIVKSRTSSGVVEVVFRRAGQPTEETA